MKELKDYTDEELRDELKRRTIEKRRNTPRKIEYVEFEATIDKIDGFRPNYIGTRFMKPFPALDLLCKGLYAGLGQQVFMEAVQSKAGMFQQE